MEVKTPEGKRIMAHLAAYRLIAKDAAKSCRGRGLLEEAGQLQAVVDDIYGASMDLCRLEERACR